MTGDKQIVDAPAGRFRGLAGEVERFLGIAYARPPEGALRWRPPEAKPAESRIIDAVGFGPDCPQRPLNFSRAPTRSEDCLRLNIWKPRDHGAQALPVYLWFHGGGFAGGTGSDVRTDGTGFARQNIILVTANYRTGIFGFFAHPDLSREGDGHSGNYGLMDCIAALKWVHRNIAAFGGDPDRITVGGVSAGAALAAFLMVSDGAATLPVHQLVLESPGAMRPLTGLSHAEEEGAALGGTIHTLRDLSSDALMALSGARGNHARSLTRSRTQRPIIDGRLVREDEEATHRRGGARYVPTLIGSNLDEGVQLSAQIPVRTLAEYRDLIRTEFGADWRDALDLYPVKDERDIAPALAQLYGDTQFTYGVHRIAHYAAATAPVWRYLFAYRPPGRVSGPFHGDEPPYAFGVSSRVDGIPCRDDSEQADALATAMHGMWGQFIRSASPGWRTCDTSAGPVRLLDGGTELIDHWRTKPMQFLTRFFDTSRTKSP